MGYVKAADVLPREILKQIQNYVQGEIVYIPKKTYNRKSWGENTDTKELLNKRNKQIHEDYKNGFSVVELSEKYFLVEESIRRILRKENKDNSY
ncbi:CD3324 family protein [Brassicibacter mesophilus]|uniref:CD3324 family protein n=1 Tax=Brassicibacter mesophilus TaxID=745119 RepID=UPI003D211447